MQKLCIRLVGCLTAACLFLAIAGILQVGTASAHTSIHVAHTTKQSWRYPYRHYYGRHMRIYSVNMDNCDCGGNQGYYINYVTVPSYPSTSACDSCSNKTLPAIPAPVPVIPVATALPAPVTLVATTLLALLLAPVTLAATTLPAVLLAPLPALLLCLLLAPRPAPPPIRMLRIR